MRGFRKIVAGKFTTTKELLAVAREAFLVQYDRSERDLGLRERFRNTPNNSVVLFCFPDTPGLSFLKGVQIDTDYFYDNLWGKGSGGQLILVGDISEDLKRKIGKDTSVTHVAECTGYVFLSWLKRAVDEANQGGKRVTVFFFGHGERVVGPDRFRTEDGFVNENRIADALLRLNLSADFWFWVDACYAWSLVNTVVERLDKTRPHSGYKSGLARADTLFSEMEGLSPYAYNAFNEREERAIARPRVSSTTFDTSQIQNLLDQLDEVRTIKDKGAEALREFKDKSADEIRRLKDENHEALRKAKADAENELKAAKAAAENELKTAKAAAENELKTAKAAAENELKTAKAAAENELNAAEARAEAAEKKLKDAEARAEAAEKKLKEAEAEAEAANKRAEAAYTLAERMTKDIQAAKLPAPA